MTAHEDNRLFRGEFLFQVLHVWQHVEAIDAAVGPEVDKD